MTFSILPSIFKLYFPDKKKRIRQQTFEKKERKKTRKDK